MVNPLPERRISENETSELTTEQRLTALEGKMGLIEALLAQKKQSDAVPVNDKEQAFVDEIDQVGIQDAVIICYRLRGAQTRDQVREVFEKWGKPYGNWFYGGNFSNRLLKKGILKVEGKNDAGQDIYALTMKGERLADEKLDKIVSSSD